MHLGDRCRRDFVFVESAEGLIERHTELLFDDRTELLCGDLRLSRDRVCHQLTT